MEGDKMPKYLVTESLRDLMVGQQVDEIWMEAEYRRGYVDCLISLTADLECAPRIVRKRSLKAKLLDHWAKLLDWQTSENGAPKEPPAFIWKRD